MKLQMKSIVSGHQWRFYTVDEDAPLANLEVSRCDCNSTIGSALQVKQFYCPFTSGHCQLTYKLYRTM